MKHDQDALQLLERAGVKPTANRILVMKALMAADSPISLIELEDTIETLERSSILRVLNVLLDNHLIHIMEDGRGISKYEVCHSHEACSLDDMHPHFYCEECRRVYCFDDISLPHIAIPEGFHATSVNFMLKGICPECTHRKHNPRN